MTMRILLFTMLPILCMAQVSPKEDILSNNNPSIERENLAAKRNAMYNLEEIKVRWKKAALENCTGVPCVDFTCGTSIVSDIDGNAYNTVAIGTQCWTKENLKVTKYNDGTDIPLDASGGLDGITGGENWSTRIAGAYTIYANQSNTGTNASNYGYLYNWYAVNDSKKLCPAGWHEPTIGEWTTLETALGGSTVAGGKLKSTTSLWFSPNIGADNSSGFTANPGGKRDSNGGFSGFTASFWSATEFPSLYAEYLQLFSGGGNVFKSFDPKLVGASVRCLKD